MTYTLMHLSDGTYIDAWRVDSYGPGEPTYVFVARLFLV